MDLGAIALRGTIGPLFVGHGAQKLFGWFGGHGVEGTGGFFESLGLRPGKRHARIAGATESIGGALLTLGLMTPLATAALTATMATAIRKVHGDKGPWVTEGGFEYPLVMIGALTALAHNGAGRPSIDADRMPWMRGPGFAAASLAMGVAGSYIATSRAAAGGPEEPESAEPPAAGARDETGRFEREEAEAIAAAGAAQAARR